MQKVLVANRGEIALRIMRTLRKMNIRSVAIFSEADRQSPHVLYADEAVCIGPAPSSASYLNGGKIIQVAKELQVDGIHPGYGFLSENADFCAAVQSAGIKFIGPGPEAMRVMGSKLAAKECVKKYDIPMVPGIDTAVTDVAVAKKICKEIGYPVLIKASAGGGGKGMRVVDKPEELEEQMQRAASEAVAAFGDGAVFIEKYVTSPRHIEIQVLADKFGNTVHLFERECSIQRRHQKVVEESPSTILTPALREQMGKAAVLVAKSCNYESTGTVEFLVDDQLNFYFLEMNTRLQVEHPVTEMITGLDLVEQQIKIARGEPLSFSQDDLQINGYALELRVYAEDPANDFLPSIGTLEVYKRPEGNGIRLDDGYEQGMAIPVYYDPMIAKLVTHGNDRAEAIAKMREAISNYHIEGVATTLPFGSFVLTHEAFLSGKFDTAFVPRYFTKDIIRDMQRKEAESIAMLALHHFLQQQNSIALPDALPTKWTRRIP